MSKKKKKSDLIPVECGDWKFSLPRRFLAFAFLLPIIRAAPMIFLAVAGFKIFHDWKGGLAGAMPSLVSEIVKAFLRSRSG